MENKFISGCRFIRIIMWANCAISAAFVPLGLALAAMFENLGALGTSLSGLGLAFFYAWLARSVGAALNYIEYPYDEYAEEDGAANAADYGDGCTECVEEEPKE